MARPTMRAYSKRNRFRSDCRENSICRRVVAQRGIHELCAGTLLQTNQEKAMSMEKTRREFLISSAVGLAASATARALPVFGTDTTGQRGRDRCLGHERERSLCPHEWASVAERSSQAFRANDCSQPGKAVPADSGFRRGLY